MGRSRGDGTTGSADGTARKPKGGRGPADDGIVDVHCPNADCGRVYTVKSHPVNRRGKCPACGAAIVVPAAKPRAAAPPARAAAPARDERPKRPAGGPRHEVRVGCVGRGNAGKTALFHCLGESLIGDALPSGLHVDAADPREVARLIRDAEATRRLMQQSGLPPTVEVSQTHYCVFDGDEGRIAFRMREVIGQILTHTLPDSSDELQARYDEYLSDLMAAHVLWVVVPCPPPHPNAHERRRYANDLRITAAYLREALRQRPRGAEPVAVALVLSKIDTLFDDADKARAALPNDTLRDALGPLVKLVKGAARVSHAAIFPVTAFGFGNAVLADHHGERAAAAPADDPFGAEPLWLLPEGASPRPFNLDALLLWSLLLGLYTQAEHGAESDPDLRGAYRRLSDDLEAADPWLLPVKGKVVDEPKRAARPRGG